MTIARCPFVLAFFCTAVVATFANASSAKTKPNIVVILADDLGARDLGCYGSTFHRTPRLDALAKRGVRFTNAYAASPVCSPSRVALLTGLHPARVGLTDWLPGRNDRPDQALNRPVIPAQLALEYETLGESLGRAGYATAHIGKWHLGGKGFGPVEQGFSLNVAGDDTGTPLSYFAPFRNAAGRFMPGLETAPEGQYLTDRLTEEAVAFVEAQAKADKPFFLYMPHYAVHTPMRAPSDLINAFDGSTIAPGQQRNPIYAAMLESLDRSVGRILDTIETLGLTNDTWIIFTSDNGGLATTEGPNTPATSNAPLREGKGWLYEGGLRVPSIVAGPGLKSPGSTSDRLVMLTDIVPTVLSLVPDAKSKFVALDGVDFSDTLISGEIGPGRTLYWHYPHYSNQGGRPGGALRKDAWKLVEFYETGRRELFDLAKDPAESRNLASEEPEKTAELGAELARWRATVDARMPSPNPGFVPNPQTPNGSIVLPASKANVSGDQLRYEPQPHKNTLGYWIRAEDAAEWDFTVTAPGEFEVSALVGCGTGQGGSRVAFEWDGRTKMLLDVPDTGGFQAFREMKLGMLTIDEPGRHRLRVVPVEKAKQAVMDLREVRLRPRSQRLP
jgi:arylsulfatase A-like enzyme